MKRYGLNRLAVHAACLAGLLHALPAAVEARTITLDGDMSDWAPDNIFYNDSQIGDGLPLNSTYSNVYVCNSSTNLYFAFQLKAPASIDSNWTHNVFMDTDMDAGTGFRGAGSWMTAGYDRLLQFGGGGMVYSVYEFQGADQTAWNWNFIGLLSYAYQGVVMEWAIPRNWLGCDDGHMRLECQVTGGDVTNTSGTETWAHLLEANVKTYTFSGPTTEIILDGNLSDWDITDIYYADSEMADGLPAWTSYSNVFLADNPDYCYIAMQCKDSGGGPITNALRREIFIDTDMDSGTGFNGGWMTGGYDLLIQYGVGGLVYSLYRFTGATQSEWSWNFEGYMSYAYSDSAIELAIARGQLGQSPNVRMAFHVLEGEVTQETWGPATEADVKPYTFKSVGNIPTLTEWGLFALFVLLCGWGARKIRQQNELMKGKVHVPALR